MSPTTASAPLATTRYQRQPPPRRGQLVVSTVDYRSLSDAATEAAVRTAHAAAALQKQQQQQQQQQQPSTVSRVVTKEAFPTAEEDSGGGGLSEPGGPTRDGDAPTFDSFEFSFDGGGDDDLTDQLDASLVALIEDRAQGQAQGQPPTAEGTTDPPPEPGAAHGGRRRPRRNKNGTFQRKSSAPPSRTEPQRRPRIVSAGSSAASLSPRGSPPPSPVADKAEGRAPPPVEGTQRPPQRPGKTFLYAASSVVAADPNDEPARPSPSGSSGRRRARRASDSDEEYLPGSELRQYASTSRRRHKKSPGSGGRRPTPVTSDDDPNTGNHANPGAPPTITTTYDMPASSRQSENTGRWTAEEHRLFLQGLERHGKGWKKIATLIKSRTVVQIRTHAQKYFQKLAKARQSGAVDGHAALGVSTAEAHDGPAGARAGAGGNMSIGTDPTSLAAAAGGMTMTTRGRRRRSAHGAGAPGSAGSTKRRSIGNVVRSSVREGRTAKRLRSSEARLRTSGSDGLDDVDEELVLPAVGTMLGHYVDHPPPANGTSAAPVPVAQQQEGSGGGRERKVTTAGHGTLTQAALEDAMYRMLTPADGRPPSEPAPSAVTSSATSSAQGAAASNDPLAIKMPPNNPVPGAPYGMPGTSNVSPTGVADVAAVTAALPSWVDASNPTAAWYDAGDGIDTLLDDAEALGWLDDTGDVDEDYPPACASSEPARVSEPANATGDLMMGSVDSLSFLVEPAPVGGHAALGHHHPHADDMDMEPNPVSAVPATSSSASEVQIDLEPNPVSAAPAAAGLTVSGTVYAGPPSPPRYASATEAVEAVAGVKSDQDADHAQPSACVAPSAPSAANLMAFPELGDMGMGDEQAFVSALLGGPSSNGLDGGGVNSRTSLRAPTLN